MQAALARGAAREREQAEPPREAIRIERDGRARRPYMLKLQRMRSGKLPFRPHAIGDTPRAQPRRLAVVI